MEFQKSRGEILQRKFINNTLNFRVDNLPAGNWTFKVVVKLDFTDGTPLTCNATATLQADGAKTAQDPAGPLRIAGLYGLPIATDLDEEIALLRQCLPFPETTKIVVDTLDSTIPNGDTECPGQLDDEGVVDKTDVDRTLNDLLWRIPTTSVNVFVYGWLRADVIADARNAFANCPRMYGWSRCTMGVGSVSSPFSGKTFVHEFGHMLGLDHCGSCPIPGSDPCQFPGGSPRILSASKSG